MFVQFLFPEGLCCEGRRMWRVDQSLPSTHFPRSNFGCSTFCIFTSFLATSDAPKGLWTHWESPFSVPVAQGTAQQKMCHLMWFWLRYLLLYLNCVFSVVFPDMFFFSTWVWSKLCDFWRWSILPEQIAVAVQYLLSSFVVIVGRCFEMWFMDMIFIDIHGGPTPPHPPPKKKKHLPQNNSKLSRATVVDLESILTKTTAVQSYSFMSISIPSRRISCRMTNQVGALNHSFASFWNLLF